MLVECFHWQAAGIRRSFEHQRRHRADQHGLGDTFRALAADVAGDFSAAGGMADMDRVIQVQRFDERREIVGVGIHLVAVPGLAGTAMAAAVMRDAAVTAVGQEHHLIFPGIRAKGPAMAEYDGLPFSPVLEVNLRAVICRDRWHDTFSFSLD